MNIQEYISSGIIEAYVMGLASEEEMRILECVQQNNPEVKQAVLDAQLVLENFASQQAIAPPDGLKSKIWSRISAENQPVSPSLPSSEPKIVTLADNRSAGNYKSLKPWAIAASLLLITSIAFNVYLNRQIRRADTEIAALKMQTENIVAAYNNTKSQLDLANSPGITTVYLAGVAKYPQMKAMVYFEKTTASVYLSLENLPRPAGDQQYQLWAIIKGQPVSLGVFDQNAGKQVQKMNSVKEAQAFAITLEKRGGSPSPTMENMYVMGKT